MVAQNYKAGVLMAASLAVLSFASQPANAQMRYQTPRGDQTVAPSNMPQQPTLNEDFANPSKINQNVVPPTNGPDEPGLPGIEGPGRKATEKPGMIENGNGDMTSTQNVKTEPSSLNGKYASTPRTGGVVLPQGIPSSIRIGPVEPVPVWQRAFLAVWLFIQLGVLLALGAALTLFKQRDEDLHGGHIVSPDTTNPNFGGSTSRL